MNYGKITFIGGFMGNIYSLGKRQIPLNEEAVLILEKKLMIMNGLK